MIVLSSLEELPLLLSLLGFWPSFDAVIQPGSQLKYVVPCSLIRDSEDESLHLKCKDAVDVAPDFGHILGRHEEGRLGLRGQRDLSNHSLLQGRVCRVLVDIPTICHHIELIVEEDEWIRCEGIHCEVDLNELLCQI